MERAGEGGARKFGIKAWTTFDGKDVMAPCGEDIKESVIKFKGMRGPT